MMSSMAGGNIGSLTNAAIISTVNSHGSPSSDPLASGVEHLTSRGVNMNGRNSLSSRLAAAAAAATSDDEDDYIPSSPGSFEDDDTSFIGADDVTAQLAAAGGCTVTCKLESLDENYTVNFFKSPVGVAAAAAIASAKKRKRHHSFELNPSIRKRQQTRLLRKLKATIDEYSTRVGQQAVVVVATPTKTGSNFKCFGAKPLEDVMKALRQMVMQELENALAQQAPPPPQDDPTLHELPPLVIDGIPTPVEKMTQAQLRAFIPLMLKYSTGRGKPGWGKESTRPPWWPKDVPWANVRMDARTEDQKQKTSQTYAGPVVQTINNADGTVSIIQVDPNNPVIHLPDGTTAHVQGVAQELGNYRDLHTGKKFHIITTQNGDVSDGEGTVALDLNHVSEANLSSEGTIIITSEDGSQIPVNVSGAYPVSGMITVPLPVYQTVVANIQGVDCQPLQVYTPIVPVPKIEPGLEASAVEVTTGLSATLEASGIITTQSQTSQDDDDDDDASSMDMVEPKVE